PEGSGGLERFWRLLQRRSMPLFALLALGGSIALFLHISKTSESLVESAALHNARLYSQALAELRTLYTSEVVETVRARGIVVRHDYKASDGSIPLPATFGMLLGKRLGEMDNGAESRLYSPY